MVQTNPPSGLTRMPNRILLLLLSVGLFGTRPVYGQIGGTATDMFLQLPVSARSAALGGYAISARDGDLGAAAVNPSFLDSTVSNQLLLTYIPYYTGINYSYASYAQTIGTLGTFDAGIKYIDYGTFTQADQAGNITGSFGASEILFNLGYGRTVLDSTISVGANIKFASSRLMQWVSNAAAVDLAGSYVSPNKRFFAGLVIQNIGEPITNYIPGYPEALPFDVDGGIAMKLKHAPFRFNLTLQHLQRWDLTYLDPTDTATINPLTGQAINQTSAVGNFADKLMRHIVPGVELLAGRNFWLSFAYNYEMRKELELTGAPGLVGLSAGFGMKIYNFQISYAMCEENLSGLTSTFTLCMSLGNFKPHKLEKPWKPPVAPAPPLLPVQ